MDGMPRYICSSHSSLVSTEIENCSWLMMRASFEWNDMWCTCMFAGLGFASQVPGSRLQARSFLTADWQSLYFLQLSLTTLYIPLDAVWNIPLYPPEPDVGRSAIVGWTWYACAVCWWHRDAPNWSSRLSYLGVTGHIFLVLKRWRSGNHCGGSPCMCCRRGKKFRLLSWVYGVFSTL